jgi:LPXTG-site transpeptidase (sortase) family protein
MLGAKVFFCYNRKETHMPFVRPFTIRHAAYDAQGNIVLFAFPSAQAERCCRSLWRFAETFLRTGATFTTVFLFLFLSFNFESYAKVARARLFPESAAPMQQALRGLSLPALPRAGVSLRSLLPSLPQVGPPDDRLIIPKIALNVPIVHATDAALRRGDFQTFERDIQDTLRFGVVHYPGTAEPGELGNVFLTGHSSNYPWIRSKYNAVFALLPELEVGDEYFLASEGRLHRYRVTEIFEVSPRDVSVLEQPLDRRISTLMTCTPIGTTLRRLNVRGVEVDPQTGGVLAVQPAEGRWQRVFFPDRLPI